MSVKEYIDKYMDIVTSKGGVRFVVAKGTNLFHYIPIGNYLSDELAKFLAEHEIIEFGSMWDKEDAEYIPIDFGYSKKNDKWYTWMLGIYKIFDTKQEVIDWYNNFYKNYLPKYK